MPAFVHPMRLCSTLHEVELVFQWINELIVENIKNQVVSSQCRSDDGRSIDSSYRRVASLDLVCRMILTMSFLVRRLIILAKVVSLGCSSYFADCFRAGQVSLQHQLAM